MGNRIDGATARASTVDTTSPDMVTVKKGDTLQSIADRLGVELKDLMAANGITDSTQVLPGRELEIPTKNRADTPAATPSPAPAQTSKSGLPPAPPPDPEAASAMKATLSAKTPGSVRNTSPSRSGAGGGGGTGPAAGTPTGVMFNAPPPVTKEAKHQQWLKELGNRPDEAHEAWKNLSNSDRLAVLANMANRYGNAFAKQFLEVAKTGKSQAGSQNVYSADPSSKLPTATPDQLKAWGYRYAGEDPRGEVWVHPSGKVILRDTSTWKFGDKQPADSPSSPTVAPGPGKTDGVEVGDDSGVRDQQDKAVELLGQAQRALQEAREMMNRQPVNWDEVNAKMMESYQAQGELESLTGDPNSNDPNPHPPDMSQVYPGFDQELEAAQQEYRKLSDKIDQNDPAAIEYKREIEELQKNEGAGN